MNLADVEALVFAGGGVRGIAYAGMLRELADHGLDFYSRARKLKVCIGTSIGALFAALVVVGTLPRELEAQAQSADILKTVAIDVREAYKVFSAWGLDAGTKLRGAIEDVLVQKMGTRGITMKQLFDATRVLLVVVVTNLNTNKAEYWSHETHPDKLVSDAVMTSMTLPPLFQPMRQRGEPGVRRGVAPRALCPDHALKVGDVVRAELVAGSGTFEPATVTAAAGGAVDLEFAAKETLYVDGGIRDNFAMLHPALPRATLGFKVQWVCAPDLGSFDRYCARLVYCVLSTVEEAVWKQLTPEQRGRVISCDVGDVSTIDFNLDAATVATLINRGRKAARRFVGSPHTAEIGTQTA